MLRSARHVGSSNRLNALVLAHLAEVDARGAYRHWACDTLAAYCAEIALSLDGEEISVEFFPSAGPDANSGEANLNFFGPLEDRRALILTLLTPRAQLIAGSHPFHGAETFGLIGVLDAQSAYTLLGFIGDGELRFERAGTTPSTPVTGSFEAMSYQETCLNPGE